MKRGYQSKSKVWGELVENKQISRKKEGKLNCRKKKRRERKVRRTISTIPSCKKLVVSHRGEREREGEGEREGEDIGRFEVCAKSGKKRIGPWRFKVVGKQL